uniref:DUF4140 domain-containing protein n=1 Tax=Macrostomum lignano TaxID=282301 RepID=A0A1I8I1Y0_9PLAT
MSLLVDENSFGETSTDPDEPQTRNTFNAASCTVKYATVYLDRAEVCRILRPKVHAGENEILVRGLTPAIDKDSIRVEVKGPATIADVSFVAKYNRDDEEKKAALRAQTQASLAAEQRALESLANRQVRLLKQRDVLNSYADTLIKKPEPASGSGAAGPSASGAAADATESQDNASKSTGGNNNLHAAIDAFDPKHMDTLNSFFDLYEKQAGKLDDDLQETKVKIQAKEEAIKVLERQLRDIEARYAELQSREVSVVLESQEATQLELHFSYVVSRARWSPKYDIRVFSNESAMKIIYYGMVQQNTGEDWENAQISLSTSMPGVGGTVPPLTVQKAHFKSNKPDCTTSVTLRRNATKVKKTRSVVKALSFHAANDRGSMARLGDDSPGLDPDDESSLMLRSPTTEVQGSALSSAAAGAGPFLDLAASTSGGVKEVSTAQYLAIYSLTSYSFISNLVNFLICVFVSSSEALKVFNTAA